jgi:hypothetical protein
VEVSSFDCLGFIIKKHVKVVALVSVDLWIIVPSSQFLFVVKWHHEKSRESVTARMVS